LRLATRHKVYIATLLSRGLLAARHIAGRDEQAKVVRRGARWRLDLREGIDLALYLSLYERRTSGAIARYLDEGSVALDIGANIGAHTLPMARRVGAGGRVVAFEPTDYAFAKLRRNVGLNPDLAPRVTCLQVLLTASPEETSLRPIHASWPLGGAGDVHPLHRGRLMATAGASAATLDASVRDLGLERVDFIKLDVDGNELSVLSGAVETLGRFCPTMIMEFAPYVQAEGGPDRFPTLLSLLSGFGYHAETSRGMPVPLTPEGVRDHCPEGGGVDLVLGARKSASGRRIAALG
jgi:FkbM family methyltransferase